ncbi:leucine-rich repeat-containing protein 24 [Tachyglossus aculeatus]|uniref:leucine-rich repeat-containing protein 24 n=1 Tax=Tachyglossus aculeatus TaxID=9261 RepID=UPI0018F31776|nr:leucine-rich repeat-containing protein 24 [Tachyglossus aculeatus]XP_038616485.1 leucine-rich repeat-containing protein 24 [Tachyglossus aculeatus]
MAPGESKALPTLFPLLGFLLLRGQACPAPCRCYGTTVECGSLGLRDVPAGIHPSTQTVFLQDNGIRQIQRRDLERLPALRYLYVQNNSIWALEAGAFRGQRRLLELALDANRVHLLHGGVFKGLDRLRVLYLAGNHITRLLDFTFHHLRRLQELHLQKNSIEMVEEQALAGLSSLALLDLSENRLRTISRAALRPLASLQVLRLTENSWRCDCALHWLRGWIEEEGQRLLSPLDKKIVCSEPPRLARRSLPDVSANSLVCIPPVVQVEPLEVAARLGDDLRVSCRASGYPQPLVTWRKVAAPSRAGEPKASARPAGRAPGPGERPDADTGSGMLFLTNVTAAHAGRYECEASNPGGAARVPFRLLVAPSRQRPPGPASVAGGREAPYPAESLDFRALGPAARAAVAVGISLLALTALLLGAVICRKHRRRKGARREEGVLYVNDYSDGPTTFAQLEEYRDERGHEMFVIDRNKPLFDAYEDAAEGPAPGAAGEPGRPFPDQGLPSRPRVAYEIHC